MGLGPALELRAFDGGFREKAAGWLCLGVPSTPLRPSERRSIFEKDPLHLCLVCFGGIPWESTSQERACCVSLHCQWTSARTLHQAEGAFLKGFSRKVNFGIREDHTSQGWFQFGEHLRSSLYHWRSGFGVETLVEGKWKTTQHLQTGLQTAKQGEVASFGKPSLTKDTTHFGTRFPFGSVFCEVTPIFVF